MPTKSKLHTESSIQKRIKEGRGQGAGKEYIPWVKITDIGSEGRSHRIFCHKTRRVHHLLSDLEKYVFLTLYWSTNVTDIREQFPLQRNETQEIAKECGIKHPSIHGIDMVMSSDFLVDTNMASRPQFAIQVKSSADLENPRTIEKLEIERRYWARKDVPWLLVTEKEIETVVKNNIEWLIPEISTDLIDDESLTMLDVFASQFSQHRGLKLVDICKKIDSAYQHEIGQALQDARKLMANGFMTFDIRIERHKLKTNDISIPHYKNNKMSMYVAHK